MAQDYLKKEARNRIQKIIQMELQKNNLDFYNLPPGMSKEESIQALDKAVVEALNKEYKAYRLYEITFKNKEEIPIYRYGIFLKPKFHFRETSLIVNPKYMIWDEITLRGGFYMSGLNGDTLTIRKNVIVSISINEEYKLVFYRWR